MNISILVNFLSLTVLVAALFLGNPADQPSDPNLKSFLPLVNKTFDSRWHWITPVNIDSGITTLNDPMTVIDHGGRPHLFWDRFGSPAYIYHAYLSDQGWIGPTPIALTLGSSKFDGSPFIDAQGRIHLVWYNDLGSSETNHYRLMYSVFDGNSWSPEEQVNRNNWPYSARLMVDMHGNLFALLTDKIIGGTIYRYDRSANGTWTFKNVIHPDHAVNGFFSDTSGGIRVYGNSGYPAKITMTYWVDGQQIYKLLGQEGYLNGWDLQMDSQNFLHTFKSGSVPIPGGTTQGLFYKCLNDQLQSFGEEHPSGYSSVIVGPKAVWDQNQRFVLAWQEANSRNIVLSIRKGCIEEMRQTVPVKLDSNWTFVSAAVSSLSDKVCVVAKKSFSTTYQLICANVQFGE